MSAAGQRLNNLTGIAAILRYEMLELQNLVDEDEGDLDSEEDEGEIGGSNKDNSDAGSSQGTSKPLKKQNGTNYENSSSK